VGSLEACLSDSYSPELQLVSVNDLPYFEHLYQLGCGPGLLPTIMLDTQYRMHPDISAFPIEKFYNNTLMNGTVMPDGTVRKDLQAPDSAFLTTDQSGAPHHMSFIDHDYPEMPYMGSIQNEGEADIVSSIVLDVLINNPVGTVCAPPGIY
jgi:superfamily I DNA and/or RNA helicase